MVDPTELITSLYEHVKARLGQGINNGPLRSNAVRPDTAEFAITAVRDGPATASGGTHMAVYVEGYFATHHALDTLPAALLVAAVRMARAMNTWWKEPVPQEEPGLLTWSVEPSNMFVNVNTNSAGGTSVMTVETGYTMLLDLEVV